MEAIEYPATREEFNEARAAEFAALKATMVAWMREDMEESGESSPAPNLASAFALICIAEDTLTAGAPA